MLDFSRKEVVDHIFDQICKVLDQGNIEYVKWDMNRSLMDVFSRGTKDQGRVMYDYVIGLYDFLERIVTRYPDLLIEGCSGGGGRFDFGMLYYVPQILAPLFSLFAALQLGRREGDALSRKWYLLFIPAALLIGGVLTNDLHQLVFRAVPGAATLDADYTHGWVYYLAMTWIVGLLLATGIIVYRKCRISESRRYAWAPLCVFLGGFMLCALSFANTYTFHKMPECFCLMFAAVCFWIFSRFAIFNYFTAEPVRITVLLNDFLCAQLTVELCYFLISRFNRNWIEIERKNEYIQLLQALLNDHGIPYPVE